MFIKNNYLVWGLPFVLSMVIGITTQAQSSKIDSLTQLTIQQFPHIQFNPPAGLSSYKMPKYVAYTLYQSNQKVAARRFLDNVLKLVLDDELSIAQTYEMMEWRLTLGDSKSIPVDTFYIPLKLRLYDEFLAQQKVSLAVGKIYAAQGKYSEAVQIFRDMFAMRSTKFGVGGDKYTFTHSVPLLRLQGEAFVEMIVIADRTRDTSLMRLLKHPNYHTVALNYRDGLGMKMLNSRLADYGMEPVEN